MLLFSFHGANTMVISFLPLLLTYRGLSGQEIGWVLAVGPAISIFAQPFWGFISDKYQTVRKVLLATSVGLVLSSLIFFQMKTLVFILGFAILFYFFQSAISPLADSLTQRRTEQLGGSFGSVRMWGSIGFATCSLLVGQLMNWIGIQYLILPYLFMTSIVVLVSFHIVDIQIDKKQVRLSDLFKLIKDPALFFYLAALLLVSITHRTNDNFLGLYISELGGQDNLIGIAWFVGVVSEALVFALAGKWFKKYHPLVILTGAGLIYALRWFLYGYAVHPIFVVFFQVLHGFSFGIFYLTAFQYVTRLIPEQLQATGHLLFATVFFGISGIIGSLGGGFILEYYGGHTLYLTMGVMALLGSCFILLYHIIIRHISTAIR
ncbi:MFS transporter [Amphibacillus sp. MSJ-3]|uniref:MFS transporter n=1 Tax=Amphibacillus sp. MSJ-3 TaxID=2841505 RepID=UPI001C0F1A48|nr:MFS transporter [Amphibacillus sp. MSJ-3]